MQHRPVSSIDRCPPVYGIALPGGCPVSYLPAFAATISRRAVTFSSISLYLAIFSLSSFTTFSGALLTSPGLTAFLPPFLLRLQVSSFPWKVAHIRLQSLPNLPEVYIFSAPAINSRHGICRHIFFVLSKCNLSDITQVHYILFSGRQSFPVVA